MIISRCFLNFFCEGLFVNINPLQAGKVCKIYILKKSCCKKYTPKDTYLLVENMLTCVHFYTTKVPRYHLLTLDQLPICKLYYLVFMQRLVNCDYTGVGYKNTLVEVQLLLGFATIKSQNA